MGFFSNLDAEIKYSLAKPEGEKLTRDDIIIRMRHAYVTALKIQEIAEQNPDAAELKDVQKMRNDYVKVGDGFFYKLIR